MMIGAANCGPHCHRIRPPRAPLLVQDPQPTGRAKVCMHTLAFPAGGWGILGYIYIYNRGAPGERIRWQWGQTIGDQHSKIDIETCDWQNNAADDVDLAGDDAVEVWRQAHRKFNFTGYVLVKLNFL